MTPIDGITLSPREIVGMKLQAPKT